MFSAFSANWYIIPFINMDDKINAIPLSELSKMTEEEIVQKFGNFNKKGGNFKNIDEIINKIDISKLFTNDSGVNFNEIIKKQLEGVVGYSDKLKEIDNAMKIVTEQLQKNPEEARKILENELKKAKQIKESLQRESKKYSNYDETPIINALNKLR